MYKTRIAVMFFILGWISAVSAQWYHVYKIEELTILERIEHPESGDVPDFRMSSPLKGEFTTRFCSDYIPPFRAGLRLAKLVYEDRGMCWSVNDSKLGYVFTRTRR